MNLNRSLNNLVKLYLLSKYVMGNILKALPPHVAEGYEQTSGTQAAATFQSGRPTLFKTNLHYLLYTNKYLHIFTGYHRFLLTYFYIYLQDIIDFYLQKEWQNVDFGVEVEVSSLNILL